MRGAEGCLGVDQGGYDPFFEPHLVERSPATVIEQGIVRHIQRTWPVIATKYGEWDKSEKSQKDKKGNMLRKSSTVGY
jgi:hypothetical protein